MSEKLGASRTFLEKVGFGEGFGGSGGAEKGIWGVKQGG